MGSRYRSSHQLRAQALHAWLLVVCITACEDQPPHAARTHGDGGSYQPPPIPEPSAFPPGCRPPTGPIPPGREPPQRVSAITQVAATPPPPVTGGSLSVSRDGHTAIVADADRDRVFLVNLERRALRAAVELQPGDQPGRHAEDGAGRVHVVLRGSNMLASFALDSGQVLARQRPCDLPRSVAYDAASDELVIACYEGALVRLPAEPGAGGAAATRTVPLDNGVRDVLVGRDQLFVSRFREAELMTLDAHTGSVMSRARPRDDERPALFGSQCSPKANRLVPAVAWRSVLMPDGGVAMLHQRHQITQIARVTRNYYGDHGSCGTGVTQVVVTLGAEQDGSPISAIVPSLVLAVDLAVSSDGRWLAVAGPGNYALGSRQIQLYGTSLFRSAAAPPFDTPELRERPGAPPIARCAPDGEQIGVAGEVVAVDLGRRDTLLVQTREPATLQLFELGNPESSYWDADAGALVPTVSAATVVRLSNDDRQDVGHLLFHSNAGAGIACASCHPEGGDDGVTWSFQGIGTRRTPDVRGGLIGTEPFHWSGDLPGFNDLVQEVFLGRMGGFELNAVQVQRLVGWLDAQPAPRRSTGLDLAASERGRQLFDSREVGCAECHSGERLTNNETVDVGTGEMLQVPSLAGVSFEGPYMHDGCATTLDERFGRCGGGDRHGKTSQLNDGELSDLVEYLRSL